jgi:hypothetical protein
MMSLYIGDYFLHMLLPSIHFVSDLKSKLLKILGGGHE